MQIIRQLGLTAALLLAVPSSALAQTNASLHEQQRQAAIQMLKDFNAAVVSRDLDRVMDFYSENFSYMGRNKAEQRRFISSWIDQNTHYELILQRFVPIDENRVLIDAEGETSIGTSWKGNHILIKENGRWKWLGKQN